MNCYQAVCMVDAGMVGTAATVLLLFILKEW